jgi:hypothetical protein
MHWLHLEYALAALGVCMHWLHLEYALAALGVCMHWLHMEPLTHQSVDESQNTSCPLELADVMER